MRVAKAKVCKCCGKQFRWDVGDPETSHTCPDCEALLEEGIRHTLNVGTPHRGSRDHKKGE